MSCLAGSSRTSTLCATPTTYLKLAGRRPVARRPVTLTSRRLRPLSLRYNGADGKSSATTSSNERVPRTLATCSAVSGSKGSAEPQLLAALAQDWSLLPRRGVASVEKYTRLPVWPVVNGLLCILLDLLRLKDLSAWIEERWGGRVCPMLFEARQTDPFILCVHHRHSFFKFDPIRPIFKLLLPEGFPAHPHRGFETVTYILQGGLFHRDSEGVKQLTGAGCTQWMTAGRGMLHEEMWAVDEPQHELYQIWVNLPSRAKMCEPRIQLLGRDACGGPDQSSPQPTDDTGVGPMPTYEGEGVVVRVVSGSWGGALASPVRTESDVSILHATIEPGATFVQQLPEGHTGILYVRSGEATVVGPSAAPASPSSTVCPTHSTAFLERSGEVVEVQCAASSRRACDVLLMAGAPLREPIAAQGSMVMNSDAEIEQAYRDYQAGQFGIPWSHSLTDEEWQQHVGK